MVDYIGMIFFYFWQHNGWLYRNDLFFIFDNTMVNYIGMIFFLIFDNTINGWISIILFYFWQHNGWFLEGIYDLFFIQIPILDKDELYLDT